MPMKDMQRAGGSSFGDAQTTWGPNGFSGRTFLDAERFRILDRKSSYAECTQHDFKRFDFDGRVIATGAQGIQATQPLLSAEKFAYYIPLRSRRPSAPYRLPKVIVNSFTNLVFGENRFPAITCKGDTSTQEYARTLSRCMGLPVKLIRARNLGGGAGTVGMSWAYIDGRPTARVHNAKFLHVHKWEDREQLIPKHVSEIYQYPKDEYDHVKKRWVRNLYWYRRDWTPDDDIAFVHTKVEPGRDPVWEPDTERSVTHSDGSTHFVWVQNIPSDDVDGESDYEGLYENFDTLDLILSVITRGAVLNLDPTLVLKADSDLIASRGLRKGSDNSLVVDKDGGDASYLELAGTSIEAGINLFNAKRKAILEVAQCVLPDPDEVAAGSTSSVALKVVYAPMLGKADLIREQYACAMTRLLEPMLAVAQAARSTVHVRYDADGNEEKFQNDVKLPQKHTQEPELDEDGTPTGEFKTKSEDHEPGMGEELEMVWPAYFPPTPADQAQIVTTLSTAVGAQAFMSTATAAEIAMQAFGRDGAEENLKVQQQQSAMEEKQSQMLDAHDAGGGDGDDANSTMKHEATMPDGSKVTKTKAPKPPKPVLPPAMGGKSGQPGVPGGPPPKDGGFGSSKMQKAPK